MQSEPTETDRPGPSKNWWWVNQGRTYKQERNGGYIWAPKRGKDGQEIFHHKNVSRVQEDDVIFHYVDGNIVAVSLATEDATDAAKPDDLPADLWDRDGYMARVVYFDLYEPVSRDAIDLELRTSIGAEGKSPFTKSGSVNQGYLFALPPRFVLEIVQRFPQLVPPIADKSALKHEATENDLERFLTMIRNLRVDRENGVPRLYKPAILLAIVDGLNMGTVQFNNFDFPWLSRRFSKTLAEFGKGGDEKQAAAAVFHLQNEPFWQLVLNEPAVPPLRGEPAQIRKTVHHARFIEPFFSVLQNTSFRKQVREVIVKHWFESDLQEVEAGAFDYKSKVANLILAIDESGFSFEPWQIACYVTALRTKPFLILAGVSGSGKSQLPQLIATATGGTSNLIPVRPDWTDSSDVLGYVQLQGRLRPGPLLRLAEEATRTTAKYHSCVIDEMNLARVEHYFAEILSRIEESRASVSQTSGPLMTQSLHEDDKDWESVCLPNNLALVGTVNMDESTHGFSRKVLDRAFTLEFSEIDLTNWEKRTKSEIDVSEWPVSAWKGRATQLATLAELSNDEREQIRQVISVLVDLNKLLNHAQLQLAYRSRDEIALFVLHANDAIDSFVTRDGTKVDPLDVALQMKVLPRITGGSGPIRRLVLALLGWSWSGESFTDENETRSLIADWTEQDKPHFLRGARFPRTCARLCLMWERIKHEGFTSFWL